MHSVSFTTTVQTYQLSFSIAEQKTPECFKLFKCDNKLDVNDDDIKGGLTKFDDEREVDPDWTYAYGGVIITWMIPYPEGSTPLGNREIHQSRRSSWFVGRLTKSTQCWN